ncbi:head maturation protease, ClpP-related [Methylophaga lonarensis]|uniref:head maturation protease, ClpP-related n=1 Tax=Methylophaga lonarensis TaxID=999151 RepID=UPI003D27BBFD
MRINRTRAHARAVAAFWNKDLNDRDWYEIKAADDDGVAEIRIYDVIGWPFVEADEFLSALDNLQADTIKVRINSPGGSVFEGMAIYNALADSKRHVITQVDSLAASMASVIAMSGKERLMYKSAQLMIHNPWTIMMGDHRDFNHEADLLESIRDQLAEIYVQVSGQSMETIQQWMDDTTWMTGSKALENKFVTEVLTAGANNQARVFDLSVFDINNSPVPEPAPEPEPEPTPDPIVEPVDLSAHYRRLELINRTA